MGEVAGSNRKRFQRLDTDFPVTVEVTDRRFKARVQNLTQDGFQLEGPLPARVGEIFSISYGKNAADSFRAKVNWVRPVDKVFQFGCTFWGIEEEAKRRHVLMGLIQFSTLHKPKAGPDAPSGPTAAPKEGTARGGE
jgi:hypothetical protein